MGSEKSKIQKESIPTSTAVCSRGLSTQPEEPKDLEKIILSLLDCKEIDFSKELYRYRYKLNQADVELILSRCGMNLNELIIGEICDSTIMSTIKKYCKNLEKFDFTLSYINEDDFNDAFIDMTKLKSLTVRSNSLFGKRREKPVDIEKILASVHVDITELFLTIDKHMISSGHCNHNFPQTLGKFTNVRHLFLKQYDIDNNAVMEISKIKSLIKLELIYCTIEKGTSFILSLPMLESLTLKGMENIEDCIINLPNESKNLKCLYLIYCETVTVNALMEISNMINLEELSLINCETLDGDVFTKIVNGCEKIKVLVIPQCKNISGRALAELSNLKYLEDLDIRETSNINDDVIIGIANNCKKIMQLSIQSCTTVSTLAYNELSKLENLELFGMADIENVNDDMFKNMHKLNTLKCTWCPNVTDVGIMRIIKNAPNLEYLTVCRTGVTTKTLVYAADETKKRTNKIVLKVTVNRHVLQNYLDLKHDSGPFILMRGLDMCCERC